MFRIWLSGFWKKNKEKIKKLLKLLGLIVLIGFVVMTVFSMQNRNNDNTNTVKENSIYTPSKTVISGSDVSKQEFKQQDDLIKLFVDYCNENKTNEAYNLLTQECKDRIYPTLGDFENDYYKIIFQNKREYSLQSWINEKNYNTYKVTFTDDFMATGNYEQSEKYNDYITIVTNSENPEEKKLNINGFIKTEEEDGTTKTEGLEFETFKADFYTDYVLYYINVRNTTDKDVLLDTLNNNTAIKLIGTNGYKYRLFGRNTKAINLKVNSQSSKTIELKFFKSYDSQTQGDSITFTKVITDYSAYINDQQNYIDYKEISINI